MDVKNEVLVRIYIVFLFVVIVAVAIFAKVVTIQLVEGDELRAINEKLHLAEKPIKAERGEIFSENGLALVTSINKYDVHMDLASIAMSDKAYNENVDSLAICLAAYVDKTMTVGAFHALLDNNRKKKNGYLKIAKNIDIGLVNKMKTFPLFRKGLYKGGFIVTKRNVRTKPFGRLARRTLGVERENAQSIGLEGFYNEQLTGEVGKRLMQKINKHDWIPVTNITEIAPKKGADIYTTINVNFQDIAENALEKALTKYQAKNGCVVIMNVETGAIKAIVNLSKVKQGYWENYNFAVGTSVEPGSTFKLATMMSLMEDFDLNLDDTIQIGNGTAIFYGKEMKDASFHNFKETSIRHAFEISSNVAMANLVQSNYYSKSKERKAEMFISNLNKWHLNSKTGIEILGEGTPLVKTAYNKKQSWSGLTLPWMAIGYETSFTPLQILAFYNGVANDGKMMKPFLVSKIKNNQKNDFVTFEPTVLVKEMASSQTINKAQDLLKGVVINGTAKNYKSNLYDFAGKTGTTQKDYGKKTNKVKHMSSFVGYFPAEKPKYSCIVWIDEPQDVYFGSKVALPVFTEISQKLRRTETELLIEIDTVGGKKLYPTYSIGKVSDFRKVLNNYKLDRVDGAQTEWGILTVENGNIILKDKIINENKVPNVVGLGIRDAIYLLENIGIKVKFKGIGKVYKQSIVPGTKLNNQTIYLDLKMKK